MLYILNFQGLSGPLSMAYEIMPVFDVVFEATGNQFFFLNL